MKNRIYLPLLLLALILQGSCSQGLRTTSPEKVGMSGDTLAVASQQMQDYVDNGRLAGISVMIIKDGAIVQRENFGYADIENQVPVKDNTIFRIYSMTKPVTAAALMTLYDEGKFDLDDRVSSYIPEFEYAMVYAPEEANHYLDFQTREMTIRNLLTHTAGLTYGMDAGSFVDSLYRANGVNRWTGGPADGTLAEKMKLLSEMPLKSQPGTKWEYSLSIDLAGYLAEVISGQPLDEFFRTRIFEPLKMDDTGFYVPTEKQERFSEVYMIDPEKGLSPLNGPVGGQFKEKPTLLSGGGGLVSTMDDYGRFCRMLLNGGELDGVRILEESTVDLIMSDQLPEGVNYYEGFGYGLAGAVELETGVYSWSGAASTNFWIDPGNNMIVITLTQLMPSDHSYAREYFNLVRNSLVK